MEIRIWIKRIVILFIALILTVGIKLYDNGLCSLVRQGSFSYFDSADNEVFCAQPIFCNAPYQKIEMEKWQAKDALKKLNIQVVMTENFDNVSVFYCFSPFIYNRKVVNGKTINIMVAVNEYSVIVGTPILKGSY